MKKPFMIAHRGFSSCEKENTLAAFIAAGATTEFFGIETDVHVTNDGHFVTIHDAETSRVSNGKINLNVEKNPFDLVRQVKLPDIDGSTNRADLIIPELSEYFAICKKYQKVAVCELKQQFTLQQIEQILQIAESLDMTSNVVYISFIKENLLLTQQLNCNLSLQWLVDKFDAEILAEATQHKLDIDIFYQAIDEHQIKLCHDNGLKVNVWTVDDQIVANQFADWGVDFITSNCLKNTK